MAIFNPKNSIDITSIKQKVGLKFVDINEKSYNDLYQYYKQKYIDLKNGK
jgi:hypothetical protein